MNRVEELEKLISFADSQGVSLYDVCLRYGEFRELDRVSGENNAYTRTQKYIYKKNNHR